VVGCLPEAGGWHWFKGLIKTITEEELKGARDEGEDGRGGSAEEYEQ